MITIIVIDKYNFHFSMLDFLHIEKRTAKNIFL